MEKNVNWMSITEFAAYGKTSISTIRRKIKNQKLETKKIDGKYFIKTSLLPIQKEEEFIDEKTNIELKLENQRLKILLSEKVEEIEDLKMLIHIYENKTNQSSDLPELPLA